MNNVRKYWLRFRHGIQTLFVGRPAMERAELVKYLAVLESRRIRAHIYLPGVGVRDDTELREALERMTLAGYVFTDSDGQLLGCSSLQLNSDERANRRRANFKVICEKED